MLVVSKARSPDKTLLCSANQGLLASDLGHNQGAGDTTRSEEQNVCNRETWAVRAVRGKPLLNAQRRALPMGAGAPDQRPSDCLTGPNACWLVHRLLLKRTNVTLWVTGCEANVFFQGNTFFSKRYKTGMVSSEEEYQHLHKQ